MRPRLRSARRWMQRKIPREKFAVLKPGQVFEI